MDHEKHHFGRSIVIGLILFLVFASFNRNQMWITEISIWRDAGIKAPNKPRPHENMGNAYRDQGKYDEAILEYTKAVLLDKSYDEVYDDFFFLARMLEKTGQWYQAVNCYELICEHAPRRYQMAKDIACESINRLENAK